MHALKRSFVFWILIFFGSSIQAQEAGQIVRQYLDARFSGDVDAAGKLWNRREFQRARAMGNRYGGVEAVFDDFMMWSPEERATISKDHFYVLRDSTIEENLAHFTVDIVAKANNDVLTSHIYLAEKGDRGWRVSNALVHDSKGWERREGRFIRFRAQKRSLINRGAIAFLDKHIEKMMEWTNVSKAARLRLERIKFEYFLVSSEDEIQKILGQSAHSGYFNGTERVITTDVADMNLLARAVIHLAMRKAPPQGAQALENALAAALGGNHELSNEVLLHRASKGLAQGKANFETLFEGSDEGLDALATASILLTLGPDSFFKMYRELCGTPISVASITGAQIRGAVYTTTGKNRADLETLVKQQALIFVSAISGGAETLPQESRERRAILTWRDTDSEWQLHAHDREPDYVFVMGGHSEGLPKWVRAYADSVAKANGTDLGLKESDFAKEPERPSGDPPYVAMLFQPRINDNPEIYESPLFARHFMSRPYSEEFMGLFINTEEIRLFDYKINKLVAEFIADEQLPKDPKYYNIKAGKLAFRLRKNALALPMLSYTVRAFAYTGE